MHGFCGQVVERPHPRHSQPEFTARGLRDMKTGVAELSAKGHNVAGLSVSCCKICRCSIWLDFCSCDD